MSALCLVVLLAALPGRAGLREEIAALARDGAVAVGPVAGGELLLAIRPDQAMVPASILKVATAGAILGERDPADRFETRFHLGSDGDLAVEGRGDPRLVSEEWRIIAAALREAGLERVRHLILDDSYYHPEIRIPGAAGSENPYDALCCALASNFNTVHVRVDSRGRITSAEPQTPLTPTARRLARESRQRGDVRLNIRGDRRTALALTGELLRAFLDEVGVPVTGETRFERVPDGFTLLYRHRSSYPLEELIRGMLRYSSNFAANQLLLDLGARRYGAPADLDKGIRALRAHLAGLLGPGSWRVEEGSGLSRANRITARQMGAVLRSFHPWQDLLSDHRGVAAKTGTLSDLRSLAGYLPGPEGRDLWFVIILPGRNMARDRILDRLKAAYTPD